MNFIIVLLFLFGKIMPFKIQFTLVTGHAQQVAGFHSAAGCGATG